MVRIPMSRVRDAIREALNPGDKLFTPTRKPFLIEVLDADEISVRVGPRLASLIRIEFDALDALPDDMVRFSDEVPVGAVKGDAAQGTLERFLQDRHGDGTMRASYAAPILVEAGVCLFLPMQAGEAQRIGLRPGWGRFG